MYRVTLDSNVYVSALAFGGKPMELLQLADEGRIEIAVSDAILDEVSRVLAGPKFLWPPNRIEDARQLISGLSRRVTPKHTIALVRADMADNRILECAEESGSDFVVSGDKHLLRLREYGKARILQPAEFLRG